LMKDEKLIWVTSEATFIDNMESLENRVVNLKKEIGMGEEMYKELKCENDRLNGLLVEFKSENNRLDDAILESKKENERLKCNGDDLRKANESL
jgi:chromosome segregation ATPase